MSRSKPNITRDNRIKMIFEKDNTLTYAEIGRRFGISRERVRQILGNKRDRVSKQIYE